jgi:hypothetical protein
MKANKILFPSRLFAACPPWLAGTQRDLLRAGEGGCIRGCALIRSVSRVVSLQLVGEDAQTIDCGGLGSQNDRT